MNTFREDLRRNGLARPRNGRVLGGVCSGLGRRFGIDPWPARLLFVLALMIVPGSQLVLYPALWFLMPSDQHAAPAGHHGYGTPQAPTA